ncbi:MAG: class II fructose-bisphosphate aldolase [Gaiellaceae bacterium]
MLIPLADLLDEATERHCAVGAFTCYDLETAAAVLATAAARDRGVIVLVSATSVRGDLGNAFLAALLAFADKLPARACVQVDHVDDLDQIESALALGAGAVMADGSRLSLDENTALVREAVTIASQFGAAVEAELGRIEGDEDLAIAAETGKLTDPAEAARFVAETGASCLAVSIGNSHGRYISPPSLDWERLRALRDDVSVPLSLHGASGLSMMELRRAIDFGITKVNVNTELRDAYLRATEVTLPAAIATAAVTDLHRSQTAAVAEAVAGKLDLYHSEEAHDAAV